MNIISMLSATKSLLFKPSTQTIQLKFWLLVLVLAALPLGQLPQQVVSQWLEAVAPNLASFPQIRIYPHDVLISIWVLLFLAETKWGMVPKRALSLWRTYRVEGLAVVWLVCSVILASLSTGSVAPFLYYVRLMSYSMFLWTLFISLKPGKTVLYLVLISLSYLVFLAGVQYLIVPDIRFLSALGWDDHYYRAAGTLFDPNFLGSLAALLLICLWGVRATIPNILFRSAVMGGFIILILTYSRASFLALLVAGSYLAWKRRSTLRITVMPLLIALTAIGLIFWLSPSLIGGEGTNLLRTRSISARIENSLQPFSQFSAQDWIVGQGVFVDARSGTVWFPDNLVILVLAGMGMVGLVLWSGVAARTFMRWRHHTVLIALWISVLTHAQFNNTLLEPFHLLYLGMLTVGLLLKARSSQQL